MPAYYELKIGHLYPNEMNLYGDRGNIIALTKRAEWRGISVKVINIEPQTKIDFMSLDILFMGGGQDRGQELIAKDLLSHKENISLAIENYLVVLLVCGGYQLFGKYFKTLEGKELTGLGILDAHTEGSSKRMIGNIVIDSRELSRGWGAPASSLVGFENHSGKTYLGANAKPLGTVLKGYGNNGLDGTEGAYYKHCYGTYMHGSLLPKNPAFTDHLILTAMARRYGDDFRTLSTLDDAIEMTAHHSAVEITNKKS